MTRLGFGICAACVLAFANSAAAEIEQIEKMLRRPIIGPDLALQEVQRYTAARIPRIPSVSSVEAWENYAEIVRQQLLRTVVLAGEADKWKDLPTNVRWLDTIPGGDGYRIRKLRYEAVPGLWIPALLYEPVALAGKAPVILNVNGHDGNGKVARYKQIRCINQAKRGMLALNVEWLGMGQLRKPGLQHYRMNQLDLCGTSGLSPFFLSMKRGLDVLLEHEHADPDRVAVAGLSGGGWQTITISSLDKRVKLTDPVAGYSSFLTRVFHHSDLGDSEQTPNDMALVADYTHLTAMMAPRPTLLTYNIADNCCFASGHALPPLLKSARPIFNLYGKEANLRAHVNFEPGSHNFEQDNREAFYRMLGDHFFSDDPDFSADEIACDAEIKSAEQLAIPLPPQNLDFNTLAKQLMKSLPEATDKPTDLLEMIGRRRELRRLVRAKDYTLKAERVAETKAGKVNATFWRLTIGNAWTVPAVELSASIPQGTALLVSDEGRAGMADEAQRLLDQGLRVVAIDPFYLGESKIKSRDFLFALLVQAVGDRVLGLQASQIAAVSGWLAGQRRLDDVTVVAIGQRVSLSATVAAALDAQSIISVELHGALKSLKQVVNQNMSVNTTPEFFCHSLLKRFDLDQIEALIAPRPVIRK